MLLYFNFNEIWLEQKFAHCHPEEPGLVQSLYWVIYKTMYYFLRWETQSIFLFCFLHHLPTFYKTYTQTNRVLSQAEIIGNFHEDGIVGEGAFGRLMCLTWGSDLENCLLYCHPFGSTQGLCRPSVYPWKWFLPLWKKAIKATNTIHNVQCRFKTKWWFL